MKRLLIIMIITSFARFCFAQDIALKDGEQSENVTSSKAGTEIVYEQNVQEISVLESDELSMLRVSSRKKPIKKNKYEGQSFRPKGYRGFFDVSGGFDMSSIKEYEDMCFGFSTTHGYQICPHIFIGVGIGVEHVIKDINKITGWRPDPIFFVPVFGNMHFNFIDRRCSPFLDIKGGYSPLLLYYDKWEKEGWRLADINRERVYLSAAIGVNYQFTPHIGTNFSFFCTLQQYRDGRMPSYYADYMDLYIGLKLGVEF